MSDRNIYICITTQPTRCIWRQCTTKNKPKDAGQGVDNTHSPPANITLEGRAILPLEYQVEQEVEEASMEKDWCNEAPPIKREEQQST